MGCVSSHNGFTKELYIYFHKIVKKAFLEYKFDVFLPNAFAIRVAKENDVSLKTAKLWIKFYKYYLVYVGWLFYTRESKVRKPDADINKYLIIPFEISQVWREHILYTEKYSELCKIVTGDQMAFLPFTPPKHLWKKQKIEVLKKTLTINRKMLSVFLPKYKQELSALFNIQSSYLKNLIHFYSRESDPTFIEILAKFEEESNNSKGLMVHPVRNLSALVGMTERMMDLINSTIKVEEFIGRRDWFLQRGVSEYARKKVDSFQNILFSENFLQNFCADHIKSYARGEVYLNEYKKFLFLSHVTKSVQSPSEEVDLIWHYHQTYVTEYLIFSNLKMKRKVFMHCPNSGSEADKTNLPNIYDKTRETLFNYFGYINSDVWPERNESNTKEASKWFNFHSILLKCMLKAAKFCKPESLKPYCNLMAGCVMGCGTVYGGPDTVGCGTWDDENNMNPSANGSNRTNDSCFGKCAATGAGEPARCDDSHSSDGCFGC